MAASSRSKPGWQRQIYYYYLRLMRVQSSPSAIARGLAVGVFAGCFPIFGFQTIAALVLAVPLQGNKVVAAIGTWISNPFTYAPIYFLNYRIGQWLLGSTSPAVLEDNYFQNWMDLGVEIIKTLFVGCAFVGLIAAVVSYFVGLKLADHIHKYRRNRRASLKLR